MCQRTFLEQQEWKDGPWEQDPSAKSYLDSVTDVLADIPGFLERVTRNKSSSGILFANVQAENSILQVQLLGVLQQLKELHDSWKVQYPNATWLVPTPSVPILETKSGTCPVCPFDCIIYFSDMARANDFCHYNIALILILQLLEDVAGPQFVQEILHDTFPEHPDWSIQTLALQICRCAEYLLLDIHNSRGYIIFTFPATIAYIVLDKNSIEARYLHYICSLNAKSTAFGFGGVALGHVTPLTIWVDSCKMQLASMAGLAQASSGLLMEDITMPSAYTDYSDAHKASGSVQQSEGIFN